MKKITNIILVCCSILFFSFAADSQEEQGKTYVITDNGSVRDVQPYVNALNKSNLSHHRLRNTRYTIHFDTGVTVEIFSAAELASNGRIVNLSDYPEEFDRSTRNEPKFSLGPNDFILEQHSNTSKYH